MLQRYRRSGRSLPLRSSRISPPTIFRETAMPLRLDIKRKLVQRSDRVKGVELHPTEPWILANLYTGNIYIWNHQTNSLVKSFEVTELPTRAAKWVARKQ